MAEVLQLESKKQQRRCVNSQIYGNADINICACLCTHACNPQQSFPTRPVQDTIQQWNWANLQTFSPEPSVLEFLFQQEKVLWPHCSPTCGDKLLMNIGVMIASCFPQQFPNSGDSCLTKSPKGQIFNMGKEPLEVWISELEEGKKDGAVNCSLKFFPWYRKVTVHCSIKLWMFQMLTVNFITYHFRGVGRYFPWWSWKYPSNSSPRMSVVSQWEVPPCPFIINKSSKSSYLYCRCKF